MIRFPWLIEYHGCGPKFRQSWSLTDDFLLQGPERFLEMITLLIVLQPHLFMVQFLTMNKFAR